MSTSFGNGPDDGFLSFDPTSDELLRTHGGRENPPADLFQYISGSRHTTPNDLRPYTMTRESGSITLPSTIPLLNEDESDPLRRSAVYGVDLTLQSQERSTHLLVLGLTGSGKNQLVIDPLRMSAITDPHQTVVSFSLKAGDAAPIAELCRRHNRRLITINLSDPSRSSCWNPLATDTADEARDLIRRFSDAARNPDSHDSEFWAQWIRCGMQGCWEEGLRSFPEILAFFSQPYRTVVQQLQQHKNPSSARLSDFLNGGSHNAETVMASILGALNSLLAQSAMRVMGKDELQLKRLFHRPVCIHVEISEPQLETYRPLVQMLARCLIDALISASETLGPARRIPATVFFDDMPSLGRLLSVERLLTLRSRAVGIVAGVQSINSLELAYGPAFRSLLEAFANKIVLPGCAQPDADYFSHASGETFVALPTYEGQQPVFSTRPLLSSAEIRRPACEHVLLGSPVTLFFGANTFQAYLQKAYELPQYADVLRCVRNVTGRERLRRRPKMPAMPSLQQPPAAGSTDTGLPPGITNTAGWNATQISELLEKTKAKLDWDQTTGSARKWWEAFESENKTRMPLVLRLAEELQIRKATITEFFLAYVYSNTDNIQANLSYLDYSRLKKEEEQKKKLKAQAELQKEQKKNRTTEDDLG
jgi:hypothetical protein